MSDHWLWDLVDCMRVVQAGKCYHLVSRVAHRALFFDDDEKNRFVDLLMRVEFFSCVRVLAYCCMSNHIHVFIYLDDARELSEEEILAGAHAWEMRNGGISGRTAQQYVNHLSGKAKS